MKMAGFYDESISNGLGWRAVLFVSGFPHHCPGCHNKEAQDFNYGEELNTEEIIHKITDNSILKGITISGGEPLCPQNIEGVLDFIKEVKRVRPNFNVWCYSGYTLEQLEARQDKITNECLQNIDVLVDGQFVESKKNPTLKFRGSENQRILDVKKSLEKKEIVQIAI